MSKPVVDVTIETLDAKRAQVRAVFDIGARVLAGVVEGARGGV